MADEEEGKMLNEEEGKMLNEEESKMLNEEEGKMLNEVVKAVAEDGLEEEQEVKGSGLRKRQEG
jgi:hypothetical protein